jgi:hypothetical protein
MLRLRLAGTTCLCPILRHSISSRAYSPSLRPDDGISSNPSNNDVAGGQRYKKGRAFVSASEIAQLINLNPYVSVGDAVERFWERNNKRTFAEALARNKLQAFSPRERLKDMGVLDLAAAAVDAEDPKQYQWQLTKALMQAATAQDRNVVRDFVNTSRGIKHEKTTFEDLKRKDPGAGLGSDVNLYHRVIEIRDSSLEYVISGYIDGVELNNNRIIEIKNRQNRLFNHVPMYEQIQCQAYLFLTGMSTCEHTESYQGQLQSTTLHFEPVVWAKVIERLNKVVVAFNVLLRDYKIQDTFLQTGDLFRATKIKPDKEKKTESMAKTARKPERRFCEAKETVDISLESISAAHK